MPYLKMLWQTESPTPQIGSWDYWCSTANTILFNCGWNCTKVNNKIAYYGMYYTSETPFGRSATPILMSPDADAVTYDTGGAVASYRGTITDINGITWYYSGLQGFASQHPVPDCIISDEVYSSIHDAAQALLDRIYAVPFHEDYQPSGYNYITVPAGDIRKTVRKALGLHLAFNVQYYSTNSNYQALSDGVDGMIDDIVNNDRSVNGNINIQINPRYTTSYATQTLVRYMTDNRSLTARINAKEIYNNLPHYQTTYNTSMNYYEREYQNATYRYYGSSAISGGLIGVRCFDRESTLSANNAGIDL